MWNTSRAGEAFRSVIKYNNLPVIDLGVFQCLLLSGKVVASASSSLPHQLRQQTGLPYLIRYVYCHYRKFTTADFIKLLASDLIFSVVRYFAQKLGEVVHLSRTTGRTQTSLDFLPSYFLRHAFQYYSIHHFLLQRNPSFKTIQFIRPTINYNSMKITNNVNYY